MLYIVCLIGLSNINAQPSCVLAGADLSYVNAVLDHQGVYRNAQGQTVDPYVYMAQKGCQMARFRVFHTPQNRMSYCGEAIAYNDLNDAVLGMQRAKAQGMQLLASLHYGDYFNDPGRQKMPLAWMQASPTVLCDSIYQYTRKCLQRFYNDQVVPQWLSIGNETTWGFVQSTETTTGWTWSQDRLKFAAALQAVADFNQQYGQQVKTMAHVTDSTALWMWQQFQSQQLTQFDAIGVSFYPAISPWQGWSAFDSQMNLLKAAVRKPIFIMETAAAWTTGWDDNYSNGSSSYGNFPYTASPAQQLQYWLDLHQHAAQVGLSGVLYWEPCWITSSYCDAWGQGSSYENNALFGFPPSAQPVSLLEQFQPCNLTAHTSLNLTKFVLWPNPTPHLLHIAGNTENAQFDMINVLGQHLPVLMNNQELDVSNYPDGWYILRITTASAHIDIKWQKRVAP